MCFDTETATCALEFTPRARKEHRCDECRRTIAVGEVYYKLTGVCDGRGFTHKSCRRCRYDLARLVRHELDQGCHWNESFPACGELIEALCECDLGQTPPEAVPAEFSVSLPLQVPGPGAEQRRAQSSFSGKDS